MNVTHVSVADHRETWAAPSGNIFLLQHTHPASGDWPWDFLPYGFIREEELSMNK